MLVMAGNISAGAVSFSWMRKPSPLSFPGVSPSTGLMTITTASSAIVNDALE